MTKGPHMKTPRKKSPSALLLIARGTEKIAVRLIAAERGLARLSARVSEIIDVLEDHPDTRAALRDAARRRIERAAP